MTSNNLRIVISTGGEDASGLNAVIRAVVFAADNRCWEVFGLRNGYQDLLDTNQHVKLNLSDV